MYYNKDIMEIKAWFVISQSFVDNTLFHKLNNLKNHNLTSNE